MNSLHLLTILFVGLQLAEVIAWSYLLILLPSILVVLFYLTLGSLALYKEFSK